MHDEADRLFGCEGLDDARDWSIYRAEAAAAGYCVTEPGWAAPSRCDHPREVKGPGALLSLPTCTAVDALVAGILEESDDG